VGFGEDSDALLGKLKPQTQKKPCFLCGSLRIRVQEIDPKSLSLRIIILRLLTPFQGRSSAEEAPAAGNDTHGGSQVVSNAGLRFETGQHFLEV
jgi:hypothetical protein